MSLRRAAVDRARAVYDVEDPSQPWIEGQPFAEQQVGPWFRCRLTVAEPTEVTAVPGLRGMAARGYRHLEGTAKLLVLPVYEDGSSMTTGAPGVGNFIAFQDGQMLQIESQATGTDEVWHVHSGVQPIRKLRRVIGFTCELRRAREPNVPLGSLPNEETAPPQERIVGGTRDRAAALLGELDDGGEVGL